MSLGRWSSSRIYLYRHGVDMRKGMDSLAILVNEEMQLDPLEAAMFVFTNKRRDKIKLLLWEKNGFWVLYKKLLKHRFKWPKWFDGAEQLTLSELDLNYLLEGYDLNGLKPHERLLIKHLM